MKPTTQSRLKKGATVTAVAVALITGFEGVRTVAYRDSVGVATVCIGETKNVHMGDHYTKQQCFDMLGARLPDYEQAMDKCLKHPDALPDASFVALLSFSYNLGTNCAWSVYRDINAGNLSQGCLDMLGFDHAGGHVLAGLKTRREKESALCLEGVEGVKIDAIAKQMKVTG